MSKIVENFKYTKEHEWLSIDDDNIVTCGITDHAQDLLTDIVFVELPEVGFDANAEDQIAVVESVKAVSDIYSPVSGKIIEVNFDLEDSPEWLNESPYDKGWMFKMELTDAEELEELMDADEYNEYVESEV